jgi:phosphate starvation-inducible protein PhoH
MILMGDMDQMDKTIKGEPGFTWSLRIFKENPRIGIHEFTIEDSVRNPLVTEMLSIMKADEETN